MRIFTEGFELGDVQFFTSITGTTWAITTTAVRTGTYAARNRLGSGPTLGTKSLPGNYSEFYLRQGFKVEFILDTATLVEWRKDSTVLGKVTLDSGGKLKLYVGSTPVATGNKSLLAGIWYLLEVHVKIDNSAGVLEARLDGLYDAGFSGDTQPGADTSVNTIAWTGWGSSTNRNCDIDDLAMNDTSGGVDDSWCGDGRIVCLMPNANGDVTQWMGSDGNQTDNYLLVDERAYDSDTTYVTSGVSGSYDLYNLAASSLSTSDVVLRVWPEYRAKKTSTEEINIFITMKSGSTEVTDTTASGILTQNYTSQYLGQVRTVDPNTSAAWTKAAIDAVQIGPKVA